MGIYRLPFRNPRYSGSKLHTPPSAKLSLTWLSQSWPGGANLTSPKVPSKISYEKEGIKWGFQIKPFQTCIECFKLCLDPNLRPPDFVSLPNIYAQLQQHGKSVQDVVRDYLQMLYDHTITMLTRSLGQTFVENTKIEFILTCPAVWSDRSKNATLQAAEGTGMARSCKIRLISEPEAAALYTLKTIQPKNLKVDYLQSSFQCDTL